MGRSTSAVEFLTSTRLGVGLSAAQAEEIAEISEDLELDAGEAVFSAGAASNGLYLLETGEVEVVHEHESGKEERLARLSAPTVIGEMELLDGAPRYATVRALSDCKLVHTRQDRFHELLARHNPSALLIVRNIAAVLAERLRRTNEAVGRGAAPERKAELQTFKDQMLKEWVLD